MVNTIRPGAVAAAKTAGVLATVPVPATFDPAFPPSITGTLNGNVLTLAGGTTLTLVPPPYMSQSRSYRGVSDAVAFSGTQVTVRGWPSATGTFVVEEYAPGDSASFVQGGIETLNGVVGVRVRPDKWVRIESAALAKQLAGTDTQAIILSGPVEKVGTEWVFTGVPKGYWLVGGYLSAAPNAALGSTHNYQMHHGNNHATVLATPTLTAPTGRSYAFGAFDDVKRDASSRAVLVVEKFAPANAGGFNAQGGTTPTAAAPTAAFLAQAKAWAAKG